jgi:hypothetical protein
MAGLLCAVFAVALGCLLVYSFADFTFLKPRWAAGLIIFGAGTAVGIGLTSCLFFVLRLAIPGAPRLSIWTEIALIAWTGYKSFRGKKPAAADTVIRPFPLNPLLLVALVLTLVVVTSAIAGAWDANPQGSWDAWNIWNLRARFLLAGGQLAQRSWSPMPATHSEYPLLLSAFVARCWAYGHSASVAVPIATSYFFLLALVALTTGGLALLRSQSLGLLVGLALLGTPTVLHEVPAQYADIPLACYLAGTLVLMLLDYPVLAGVFASMAAWTKDEGVLFLAVFLAATGIFRPRQVLRIVAGALPVSLLVFSFKAVFVRGTTSLLGSSLPGLVPRLRDPSRYWRIMGAFGSEFAGMGLDWYHPVLPLLALAIVLRFDRDRRRDQFFCGAIYASLLLAYFCVYLITSNDLGWQLQTSLSRLLVQLWPCLLLAAFIGLRAPESTASVPLPIATPSKGAKARRKTKA